MNFSNPANLLIATVYYIVVAFLAFFSIFGVYILIRYGKSTLLSFAISIFYAFIFLAILASSYSSLQSLLQ